MTATQPRWQHVTLYGVEHSPWVQGVLIALAHHNIPTRLTSYPFNLSWFWRRGPVFPALQLMDGTTHLDSFNIYQHLEDDGFPLGVAAMTQHERRLMQVELEDLFSNYALGRCSPGKKWRFIQGWSTMREVPHSTRGTFFRALLSCYFWVLIHLGIRAEKTQGRTPYNLDLIERQLRQWDARLTEQRWLTGPDVGFLDFALWGHLQCMVSGLTDELLPILQRQPHLMTWLTRMMDVLPNHDPMYTRRLFEPQVHVSQATQWQRWLFWCAWFGWAMLWPFTLVVVALSLRNRFKNPARSGAVARRYRKELMSNTSE